jgi:CRP-like cAMP-binding protein
MKHSLPASALARASSESVFVAGEAGPLWRVVQGLVRLDRDSGAEQRSVQLALPGDLIGVEALCDSPYRLSATAFTACELEPVPTGSAREDLLRQALLQQQNRCQDMAALRTGTVMQRIGHLLRLLRLDGAALKPEAIRAALPALREVAQLIDAKTETVCRALAALLPPRGRKSGPVRRGDLAGAAA